MGPSVRFSGNARSNFQVAVNLVKMLNAYAPQIIQLVDNGIDLYTAIQRVVSVFNNQHNQNVQVEHTASVIQQQPTQPIIQAFWDYNNACFRLVQWNHQYQQWQWIQ